MKTIYWLGHVRLLEDEAVESKTIGFYTSLDIANETIERYRKLEGFRDYPECFVTENYIVEDSINSVFFLEHEYTNDNIYDYTSVIGLYSTEEEALSAQKLAAKKPKYIAHPDGFTISEYKLNEDVFWAEGFFTWGDP